ncbi:MAG: HAD hydrolase family protein [bacterium]|nr:HAD hydrolase family protein [bacterium]
MEDFTTELRERIKPIRLLLMDVDGTLTDGKLYYSADWVETKAFDVRDGFGIYLLHIYGLKSGIITGRESKIVTERARELDVKIVYQGRFDKAKVLEDVKRKQNLSEREIAYVGDDLFDLPLLLKVGFSAAPADAHPEVRRQVHYVAQNQGGRGAVREIIELILKAQGYWDDVLAQFSIRSENP